MLAVALWLGFWGLMRAYPGDQSWSTAAFAGALGAIVIMLRRTPPLAIASWEEGAYGEEQTAKQLRALEREGWVVLHDLANGSKNFDHVVLGPNGVFCLNSKWSGYRLEEDDRGRLVGRHHYDEDLDRDVSSIIRQAKAEAAALSKQISDRCGRRLWVQPVVVWWGEVANGGKQLDGVGVVQGKHLVDRLRAQSGRRVPDFDHVV
ncbi:nuclease-related domain-containing protein, partial [Actinotalea sp.]|uniref:nuclease-related domain-containing protein n=1 Tax=Actinotalea sp. TaxID=1872145 RepID=UPI003566176D